MSDFDSTQKKNTDQKSNSREVRAVTPKKAATEKKGTSGGEKKNANSAKQSEKKPNPEKKSGSEKKPKVDLDTPKSAKTVHRILPVVLGVIALFLGITFIVNLCCNFGNKLQGNASAHWFGVGGYGICYFFFGIFGPGVFLFPILLGSIAIGWRRLLDNKKLVVQSIIAFLTQVFFSSFLHVIVRIGGQNPETKELYAKGAQMVGGGVFGGLFGNLLVSFLNNAGAMILCVLLLITAAFLLLGISPLHLWNLLKNRRLLKKGQNISLSESEAEEAMNKAKMDEKVRSVTTKQQSAVDENGAPIQATEKTGKKKLAPMPMPHLDPGTGKEPYVPSEVRQKMNQPTASIPEAKAPAKDPRTPLEISNMRAIVPPKSSAPATPAATAIPQTPADPEKNKDASVDPIFPKSQELRPAAKTPRKDRDFDLKNVFVDLDDENPSAQAKHAPLPPEKPLNGTIPKAMVTGVATDASTVKKPSNKPAPTFGKLEAEKQEYGLSDEEFEKLEATHPKLPQKAEHKVEPISMTAKKDEPKKEYVFPPINILQEGKPMTEENLTEINENMNKLAQALASYRVGVSKIKYSYGPTVTRYEVVPDTGVRVRSIVSLSDDLARVLRSIGGIRIEAPIPGTDEVGIEIPNPTRQFVMLRTLLESQQFKDAKSLLTAGLGLDISGKPLFFDIARMPHMLIAGATGSGKSVCINAIIVSLIYKAAPSDVRLILIDPKMVEFSIYKNIPHLMAPIVTSPKDAAGALQAAVDEMERRFAIFEQVGVRDLKGYTATTKNDPDMPNLPQIVIIIDELADLMMTAKDEVETSICRIAQKARAAGIHLIVGTQRPSVDVVTGLIKSNIPSRIAFTVASQIDSKTILDYAGAEKLMGNGDMLFVPFGQTKATRVQGAYVDEKEVGKICEFLRATNGLAQYDEHFISRLKELAAQCGNKGKNDIAPSEDGGDAADDPKYPEAVRVAIEEGRIATSLLQRKLSIGYGRAAKLIDQMYEDGYVSAPDGSKPRSILITKELYMERFMDGKDEES